MKWDEKQSKKIIIKIPKKTQNKEILKIKGHRKNACYKSEEIK
jgi:hypothetical protein